MIYTKVWFLIGALVLGSCTNFQKNTVAITNSQVTLSDSFKAYWFAGKAEVTSYTLTQNRYGQQREGKVALIYVTEDFDPVNQVKTSDPSKGIPVLKCNLLKNFQTGMYPYQIMQSSFGTIDQNQNKLLKATYSQQEWCGHIYVQLNADLKSPSKINVKKHSYFEGNNDQALSLSPQVFEAHIWHDIRLNGGADLPIGTFKSLPALEFLILNHKPLDAYTAIGRLDTSSKKKTTYTHGRE